MEIPGRKIGYDHPCFIIAEAGVNHNGDVKLAKRLVDAAAAAGADAVKFQTWITEKLLTPEAELAEYQRRNISREISQFEMLKQLELSQYAFREIKRHAAEQGILFFSTPDEEDSADFLDHLGVALFKIGSGEVTNLPYLRHVAWKERPIILSTGMSTLGEVEAAVRAIEETGNRQLCLLHCVSEYPADPADCNLRAMDTLSAAFGYPVGFSDHTVGIDIAIAAVARGACVIEKHFTLSKDMEGPDHKASLDTSELARMVRSIRIVESSLGDGKKRPSAPELRTRALVQKRIVTARHLSQGEIISESDVLLRRAGSGVEASSLSSVIGRITRCSIPAHSGIEWAMLS
jgi:N-acetylneuraminate synthase/N,N'-diacetyllegionaminate synthase